MNLFDQMKNSIDSLADRIVAEGNPLPNIVRVYEQMLTQQQAYDQSVKQCLEVLTKFGNEHAPDLQAGITQFNQTFEAIEQKRIVLIEEIRKTMIAPINALTPEWAQLNTQIKYTAKEHKKVEQAQKELDKKALKNPARLKPHEMDEARQKLAAAQQQATASQQQLDQAMHRYSELQNTTFSQALNALWTLQRQFYLDAAHLLS